MPLKQAVVVVSTYHARSTTKALLARAPLTYALGFHTCAEVAAIVSMVDPRYAYSHSSIPIV